MLTFLTSPKEFSGLNAINQRNALRSWLACAPGSEVIVYGDSPGSEAICRELSLNWVPEVASSPTGAPYFNEIVADAERRGRFEVQVYLNCDIMLDARLPAAVRAIPFRQYLMIGQRTALNEGAEAPAVTPDLVQAIERLVKAKEARLDEPSAMDYFVFPRGQWRGLKPLIVGRGGYDTCLMAFCLINGMPVVDATYSVLAVHQFHDYSHVSGGKLESHFGKEAALNKAAYGVAHSGPNIADAGWTLREGRLVRTRCRGDGLRALELEVRFRRGWGAAWVPLRLAWRVARMLGLLPRQELSSHEIVRALRQPLPAVAAATMQMDLVFRSIADLTGFPGL